MKANLQNTKYKIKPIGALPEGDPIHKRNTQRGITLVALIITVIVLLILAMVSIRLIMNGGIIDRAERGTDAYSEAEIKEKIGTAYSEYQLAKYQNGITFRQALANSGINVEESAIAGSDSDVYTVTYNGKDYPVSATGSVGDGVSQWKQNADGSISKGETTGIQVGDTVKYETILAKAENAVDNTKLNQLKSDLANYSGDSSSTDNSSIARDNLTWKVLDVKDGKIRLISATPTNKKIKLQSYNGYNNAVYLIDEACHVLYSSNKGTSKNLKIEDIEEKIDRTQFDYTQYPNSKVDTGKYGGTKEYSSNLKYPNIYINEIGCKAVSSTENKGTLTISEQTNLVTGWLTATDNKLKVTQTLWKRTIENTDFIDTKYNTVILNNLSTYWLSSRSVVCDSSYCGYGCYYIEPGRSVNYIWLYLSSGSTNYDNKNFRPVVTLNSNVQLEPDGTNTWKIVE